MSIQLVVVAAIALIILVVVVLLFTGKFKVFGTGLQKCSNKNGICESACESNEAKLPDTDCPQFCCVDLYDSGNDDDT